MCSPWEWREEGPLSHKLKLRAFRAQRTFKPSSPSFSDRGTWNCKWRSKLSNLIEVVPGELRLHSESPCTTSPKKKTFLLDNLRNSQRRGSFQVRLGEGTSCIVFAGDFAVDSAVHSAAGWKSVWGHFSSLDFCKVRQCTLSEMVYHFFSFRLSYPPPASFHLSAHLLLKCICPGLLTLLCSCRLIKGVTLSLLAMVLPPVRLAEWQDVALPPVSLPVKWGSLPLLLGTCF